MPSTRVPLMESSDNNASPSPSAAEATRRRTSGRVVRPPQKFSPEVTSSRNGKSTSKRKRVTENDDEDAENEAPDADLSSELSELDDGDDDDDDDESAVEEPTPRPKKGKSRTKKPAAKRAKVNGTAPTGDATASASNGPVRLPNRPKKTVRVAIARRDGDGVYAEIFGSGDSPDDVAANWFQRYQANDAQALTDLVNCVLLAAGCDQNLTEDDIRDPENSTNRLSELEEAYEQTTISDYPLISKAKSSKNFREQLVGFFESLISLLHQTDVLYTDEALLDNVQRWVGIMSSSALRPFRHTATTVGLSLLTAMIAVTKQLDDRITKSSQALQAESNRRSKNKNLVANTQKALDGASQNRQFIDEKVKDLFNIVFVHRYRDIDDKIRSECIEALGTWICTLPTVYMAPEYLRYLGWLLSDVAFTARQEVLKQLGRVLKRDAEKLAHFIDRFRPRLVEMATSDREISVRVAAIAVVDILRSSGMLEPEEVDSTCKLLFDTEARIRKAVVPFFAELVQEFVDNKVDEIGGSEALDDLFGENDEDDYNSPRKEWIHIKSLAENLAAYNSSLDQEQDEMRHGLDVAADVVSAIIPETRIALATQALYEKMPEISNWHILAGYLLFDHTTSSKSKSKSNSTEAATRAAVAPSSEEEAILLEVLSTAVKESLVPGGEHDKTKKRPGRLDLDAQEDAGVQLAAIIPQLLNKFGSDPHVAGIILRLEHYLDLEVFQQLLQNATTYDKLLDEITRQFGRHVDETVLNEAAMAFIHARQYEELEELTDSKLTVLWDNTVNSLRNFEKTCELSVRGNLGRASLNELANVLKKISKLARISDCVDVMEAPGTASDFNDPVVKILTGIVHRGFLAESDDDLDDPEDEVVAFAIKGCQFYFMWKIRQLQVAIQNGEDLSDAEVDHLVILRKDFVTNLIHTLSSRGFNDDLRLFATGSLCDCCALFVFLRPIVSGPQANKYSKLRPLLEELPSALMTKEIIPIFDAAEREYAKQAKKTLNEPADDEDPLDDELPPEEDEDEELTEQERVAAELKAEKILCELTGKLIIGILGKVIDHSGPHAGKLRKRLMRNKTKLGLTFRDVVAFLDDDHLREMRGGGKKKIASKGKGKETAASKKSHQSAELVIDSDSEDDPFAEDPPEEGTVEDLRNRELLDDPIEDDEDEERPPEPMEEDNPLGD
ncbi:STAG domain-containing protein [Pseudomassariella vexata]|uniref:STAG domain-containing protein n=1 Tax=Pseudomassariella vexata TaxID=1141098 RepID=A0A1Y2EKI7_9PEZI|nr:STAG domain-containing protein [Pseudomassariella vexata]ORY71814.1 STAG domain-containing protein [Pseudomassariella vexata]